MSMPLEVKNIFLCMGLRTSTRNASIWTTQEWMLLLFFITRDKMY